MCLGGCTWHDAQILLSKGRVLKDADTLDQSRVVSGQELHVGVKPGGAPAQPTATAASGAGTATTAIPAAQSGPRTKDQVVKDTFDALAALKS